MTTTGWEDSSRGLDAPTTCRIHDSSRAREAPGAPKPMNLAAWAAAVYLGPPWGPRGPAMGAQGHTPTHEPRFRRTRPDGRVGTTICMAKEMRFLRLLLEWPGFPTLSYGVIQCTAAVPLHGKCFFTGISFWENKILLLCSLLSSPPAPN